jgi:radical SAM protein with 4Fe4S-binding SPASM domain
VGKLLIGSNHGNQVNQGDVRFTDEFKLHIADTLKEVLVDYGASFLEIELTGRCRNNCTFCGVGGPASIDLSIDALLSFLKNWHQTVLQSRREPLLSLTGGDPLLHPNLPSLLTTVSSLNISFMFKTNAHSIYSSIDTLQAKPSAIKLTIPDSIEDGRRDSLTDLYRATSLLQKQCIPVIWQASVHSGNWKSLLKTIETAGSYSPVTLAVGRILPIYGPSFHTINSGDYERFLRGLLSIYQNLYTQNVRLRFKENLWIPLLEKLDLLPAENAQSLAQCCDCFTPQLSIDRTGNVYPCGLIRRSIIGTINDHPQRLFINRKSTMDPKDIACSSCKNFSRCGGCVGASESITGSRFSKDPHCIRT